MQEPIYLLAHGWGLDARSMQPLAQALSVQQPKARIEVFDMGFFGKPSALNAMFNATDEVIVVGHSYGFAYCVQAALQGLFAFKVKAWVSLCGFTQTSVLNTDGDNVGLSRRDIHALHAGLKVSPQATLHSFYERCGSAAMSVLPDVEQAQPLLLREHLLQLRDLKLDLTQVKQPIMALAGTHDVVVPMALTQHCFASLNTTTYEQAADHALPISHALWCAQLIASWARVSAVASAFNVAAQQYDKAAHIQWQTAQMLIPWLQSLRLPFVPKTIAEVGCGTGFLTEKIVQTWPNTRVLACDIAPAMVQQTQQRVMKGAVKDTLDWLVCDAQQGLPSQYDAVLSSLCLQWFQPFDAGLARLWQSTDILVFSVVLADSFTAWRQAHQQAGQSVGLQNLPSWAQVQMACAQLAPKRLNMHRLTLHEQHPTALDFARSIKAIGAHVPVAGHVVQGLKSPLRKVLAHLPSPCTVNYEIGLFCLSRY